MKIRADPRVCVSVSAGFSLIVFFSFGSVVGGSAPTEENKLVIGEHPGFVELLVQILEEHVEEADTMEYACGTLAQLAIQRP